MSLGLKRTEYLAFVLIFIAAALLRFPLVSQGFFAFTHDQGRDLLAVAEIVNGHLTLIGPTTGLQGIFYGPWWYYFLTPLYLVASGDPQIITQIFSLLGIVAVIAVFFLAKKLTGSSSIAFGSMIIAAVSGPFLTASSQIWSPSLVPPLMVLYIWATTKLLASPTLVWSLILGLTVGLVLDTGAAFGIMLFAATTATIILHPLSLRGHSRRPWESLLRVLPVYLLGFLIILAPRIIFDLRHDFLITKSIIAWISQPQVYQEKLDLLSRLTNRADLFLLNFSQTFAKSNKVLALLPLSLVFLAFIFKRNQLFGQNIFRFLLIVTLIIYLGFSLYPDSVWDYYLVGLPPILMVIFALTLASFKSRAVNLLAGVFILVLTANTKLLSPFSITWEGDGAIYRNQKNVLDNIKTELRGDYSLHFYTPARFDYAFIYLVSRLSESGLIDEQKEDQKRIYLIIRDDSSHSYLTSGWYGDKTQHTSLLYKQEYTGNIIMEKHAKND